LELAHDAIRPLLQMELQRTSTSYKICASHITVSKKNSRHLRTYSPIFVATSHVEKPPQVEPCSKCPVGSWTDDRDSVTKDWQKRADDRIKLGYANKCPYCGVSVSSGVWVCKNCGREIQVAPLLLAGDGLELVYENGDGRYMVDGYQEIVRRNGHRAERVDRDQLFLVLDLTFPRWRDPSYAPEEPYERAIQLYAMTIARRYEWHVYEGWTAQEVAAQENVLAAKHGYPRNIKRAAISKFVRQTDEWVREVLATFDMLGKQAPP
jgi:ribosomal protein L32